jgi:hypothetical protein
LERHVRIDAMGLRQLIRETKVALPNNLIVMKRSTNGCPARKEIENFGIL